MEALLALGSEDLVEAHSATDLRVPWGEPVTLVGLLFLYP